MSDVNVLLETDIFECNVDESENEAKRRMLTFRVSQTEYERVAQAASLAQRKMADYVRLAVLKMVEHDIGPEVAPSKRIAKKKQ